jgi:hypothetical protein
MLLSRRQNAEKNHDIKTADMTFANVAQFRYMRKRVTDQNLIQEEIKRRLNSGNRCYQSVQNLLSSRLLYKNVKIKKKNIYIVTCQRIAKQRLDKHPALHARKTRTNLRFEVFTAVTMKNAVF